VFVKPTSEVSFIKKKRNETRRERKKDVHQHNDEIDTNDPLPLKETTEGILQTVTESPDV